MTRSGACVITIALALLGCGRSDAPTPALIPAEDDPVARWAALLPDSLRHRGNACPFECCVYRDWTPTGEVPLRPEPSHGVPATGRIPPDQTFLADSGFVRLTGVSLVAVRDSVIAGPPGTRPFAPGDTLVVLDYVGEGFFNVWDGERVVEISGFWGAEVFPSHGDLLGGDRYAREWWVHATTRAGERGWFNADSVARLRGADACGVP